MDGGGGFAGVSGECFANSKVCDGKCVSETDPATGCGATGCEPCSFPNADATCAGDLCDMAGCKPGFADCSGGTADGCETDLATNPLNCGACGNDCTVKGPTWIVCKGGECKQSNCPAGEADCDLDEVCETNITNDVNNCGLCGIACNFANAAAACESGQCVMKGCDPGWADCDNDPLNGCEVNTNNDTGHCGGCGKVCQTVNALTECKGGTCNPACSSGWGTCDGNPANGCETPLNTINDCGTCGKKCTTGVANATPICQGGACNFSCNGSLTKCGNACRNTSNDVNHCGQCGKQCTTSVANATAVCAGGSCDFTCNGTLTKCGNACRNTTNDVNNCGSCGTQCTAAPPNGTPICSGSSCTFTCGGGTTKCGNACKNLNNDPVNCGQCGKICPDPVGGSATCSGGTCGINCGALTQCGSSCTNTNVDPNNCGGCGTKCTPQNAVGGYCNAGNCDYASCMPGHANCDGDKANGCETPLGTNSNCSSCGDDCKNPKTCQGGTCKT